VSDTDSFIDEVTEEVRRDRLFKLMRRWGWIPISLVLLLVGTAAYIEWSKARNQSAAQKLGAEILQAVQLDDAAARATAYGRIQTQGDTAALLALLASGDALADGNRDGAISNLTAVASDATLSDTYRHLAEFKLLLILGDDLTLDQRLDRLQAIAAPGAPYRLLAEEQMAIAEVSAGQTSAAIERLLAIVADDQVTPGLRRRVSQLIVALGGDLTPA